MAPPAEAISLQIIHDRIDRLEDNERHSAKAIAKHDAAIEALKDRVDSVGENVCDKIDDLGTRIDRKMDEMSTDIKSIRSQVDQNTTRIKTLEKAESRSEKSSDRWNDFWMKVLYFVVTSGFGAGVLKAVEVWINK